jgi:hypothetical protein
MATAVRQRLPRQHWRGSVSCSDGDVAASAERREKEKKKVEERIKTPQREAGEL